MLYQVAAPVASPLKPHAHSLTMSSNSSTAFPFPPPLYLSTLNSLIHNSSPVGTGLMPSQMSSGPWALHSPSLSPLTLKSHGKNSDSNNNELSLSSSLPSTPLKKRSDNAVSLFNNVHHHDSNTTKSAKEDVPDTPQWSSLESEPMSSDANCDNSLSHYNRTSSKLHEKEKALESNNAMLLNASLSPFLLPQFGTSMSASVSSPTFALGLARTSQSSPHTPSQVYGPPYPYMLPPNLFYYQTSGSQSSYSPTNQSTASPVSPFLVPNVPRAMSPSSISPASNTSGFSAYRPDDHHQECHESLLIKHKSQSAVDLVVSRASDVESSLKPSPSSGSFLIDSRSKLDSVNGLKRKSPIDENDEACRANEITHNHREPSTLDASECSRKHRILKPPNINISECDYRHSLSSGLVPSPLMPYASTLSHSTHRRGLASSPYPYLESSHVPLSAPPSNSSLCFDFPPPGDQFVFTPPTSRAQAGVHEPQPSLSSILTSGSSRANQCMAKPESLSSILKDKKKKCLLNGQHGSNNNNSIESKVTFQMPQPLNKASENQENKFDRKSTKDKRPLGAANVRKSYQYPGYFRKGSTIELGNGALKKVEELSTEDFIQSASLNGKLKVELSEVLSIKENIKKGLTRIEFLVGQAKIKVWLDSAMEHPYYVYHKGWSSYSPSLTAKRYGLNCHRLSIGDIVVTLASKTSASLDCQSKSFRFQQTSRSLACSTGSLSSSSTSSSSSSSLSALSNVHKAHSKLASSLAPSLSSSGCPPPAHLNESLHNTFLHSSSNETALDLNLKCNNKLKDSADNEEEEIDVEKVDDL